MKSESTIQNEIALAITPFGMVFRTNSGNFYQGKVVYSKEFKQPVLINLRMVKGLPAGFSDLLFLRNDGQACFVETKRSDGKARKDQENFIDRVRTIGYIAGIARTTQEALEIVERDG